MGIKNFSWVEVVTVVEVRKVGGVIDSGVRGEGVCMTSRTSGKWADGTCNQSKPVTCYCSWDLHASVHHLFIYLFIFCKYIQHDTWRICIMQKCVLHHADIYGRMYQSMTAPDCPTKEFTYLLIFSMQKWRPRWCSAYNPCKKFWKKVSFANDERGEGNSVIPLESDCSSRQFDTTPWSQTARHLTLKSSPSDSSLSLLILFQSS